MNCISIKDIELLNILLTAVTLMLAWLGIRAWKTQLKGTYSFTKKKDLALELRKFETQYHNIIMEIQAFLEVFSDTMEKEALQSVIGESLQSQSEIFNRIIESIR